MKNRVQLSEKSTQAMESRIPELAVSAVRQAYFRALTTSGKVVEAVNGKLVETSAEGGQREIRELSSAPVPVAAGSKRVRGLHSVCFAFSGNLSN
ncbi:hypothetical protein [Niveibacterium terrae]|uniref:hypothetical protein n=1 Tax=Niveibacterium terrae TaxID=3373598 RepID=UPI003A91CC78